LSTQSFRPRTRDGWRLEVKRFVDPRRFDPSRRPVVVIPGYGMNAFILSHHPTGPSLVESLTARGFEVWTANIRAHDGAKRIEGSRRFGFEELALIDLPCVFDTMRINSRSLIPGRFDLIGCSMGATLSYAYLAHHPDTHGVASMVALGGPLRWVDIHPLIATTFRSPQLTGMVPIFGVRRLIRHTIPLLKRARPLSGLYANMDNIDFSEPAVLTKTITDPTRRMNREVSRWLNERDLIIGGVNTTLAMREVHDVSVMCVLGNGDGIVPPASVLSVLDHIGSTDTEVVIAGDDDTHFAHADLFIARGAQEQVFAPIGRWLERSYEGALIGQERAS